MNNNFNESVFQREEKIIFALRSLYLEKGYKLYKMSKFEEYDLYAKNKDYLVSDNVITFTDTNGKLLALKPDVTLSIIKNLNDDKEKIKKLFYNENVYRVSKGSDSFSEIMQTGLECFGDIDEENICEVLYLAAKSLKEVSNDCILNISNLSILEEIIYSLDLPSLDAKYLYKLISEKNLHEIDDFFKNSENEEKIFLIKELLSLCGNIKENIKSIENILSGYEQKDVFKSFINVLVMLSETDVSDMINIDFSVVGDTNYYNGIVFKGFIKGVPEDVLSGGQYDKLMMRMKRHFKAVGFAVYMDMLERLDEEDDPCDNEDDFINIALPKGRLGENVYELFEKAGYECPSIHENSRKLIFENKEKGVRYFWVKPSDVAIYVERGAADIGVCGKDILLEYEPLVYELLDLDMGKCRMAVATKKDFKDDPNKTLTVATKFSNTARNYYQSKGRDIDIIHLNGSIEIAPILGLSDVIVDIVETGTTLKENDLVVYEEINPISARLIANRPAYGFKNKKIQKIVDDLSDII